MYHAALQEQAQRQRQTAMLATAGRLGLPVVVGVGRGREERGSVETMGTDISYDDNGRERSSGGNGGMGVGRGGDTRTPILHSTRASSGVFPEGREEEEEKERDAEYERALEEDERIREFAKKNSGERSGDKDSKDGDEGRWLGKGKERES